MSTEIEVRIAHSQSSANKVWVTLVESADKEFAVGFDKRDINEILQVNETYYDELTDEEAADSRINDAQAALALACYYPHQFVHEPENNEAIAYLEDLPTKYISTKHINRVFDQYADCTAWQVYTLIAPRRRAPAASAKKPTFRKVHDEEPLEDEYDYDDDDADDDVSDDQAQYDDSDDESDE